MIELRNIVKSYRTGDLALQVLKGISFTIPDGDFVAITGPSGSGKSTLMNIIGCLDTPTSGAYLLDGQNVATLDDDKLAAVRNRRIGFVFQSFNLIKRMTALNEVALPLLYAADDAQDRHTRAVAALKAVGLGDRMNFLPNQLSGGQQQRVAIARALVTHPSLILADEPTGNLDSRSSVEIMEIFQLMNRTLGLTVVLVTHEPDIVVYARRVLRIRDGILAGDETIANPRTASADLHAIRSPTPITARAVAAP